jgi:hypothetical protein
VTSTTESPGPELETEDPIAALGDKSIAVRAAACRDLTKMGTVEHLPRLAQAAGQDKSPAVRLGTVAAASDILSRRRLDAPDEALTEAERTAILDLFKRVDPANNPGVFSVFGTLDLASGLNRVGIGLRDPRQEVRKGAGVGLMRLCISRARLGDAELEAAVVGMLTDRRMRPDAIAEIALVCMAAGYTSAVSVLERVDPGGVHQDIVDTAIDRLVEARERPVGLWLSDGRDAGEMREVPVLPATLLVVTEAAAFLRTFEGGWETVELPAERTRRMFYRRAGTQEPAAAVQTLGHTFHSLSETELLDVVDRLFPAESADWPGSASRSAASAAVAAAVVGDSPEADRARALALADAGDFAGAAAELDEGLGKKKAPRDLRFLLGLARHAVGDAAGARAAWEECVAKSRRKKDWYVVAATARLEA